jgi:hypothetical protein
MERGNPREKKRNIQRGRVVYNCMLKTNNKAHFFIFTHLFRRAAGDKAFSEALSY